MRSPTVNVAEPLSEAGSGPPFSAGSMPDARAFTTTSPSQGRSITAAACRKRAGPRRILDADAVKVVCTLSTDPLAWKRTLPRPCLGTPVIKGSWARSTFSATPWKAIREGVDFTSTRPVARTTPPETSACAERTMKRRGTR